jgi:hypothetical protein
MHNSFVCHNFAAVLMDCLNRYAQGEPVAELHEGDLVAAPFEYDSQWYRTEVARLDGENIDLYYVDFGDSSYVSKDCVRVLR